MSGVRRPRSPCAPNAPNATAISPATAPASRNVRSITCSPLSFQERLERKERALPARLKYFIVAAPARAFFESALPDAHACRRFFRRARHLERHRTDGVAVRRQEVHVGDE